MAEFKFYLNGTEVEEPMNWMDSKFEYRRDPDLPGLITTFVADVEFYGSGYDLIKQEFENGSGCGEVLVKIEELCTNGINREGIIFLSEIDLDLYRCVAKCNIEDNTIYGKLSRLKDVKIQVNCGKTVNGQVLAPIQSYPMPFRDINYSLGLRYDQTPNQPRSMYRMYRSIDVLQHYLNYITDNDATIVSNFFSNIYNEQICGMIVYWVGNLSVPVGDTVVKANVSWTDVYGNPQTLDVTATGLTANNIIDNIAYALQWNGSPTGNEVDLYQGILPRIVEYITIGTADTTYSGQYMIRFRFFQSTSVSITIRSFPSNTLLYTSVDYYKLAGRRLETPGGTNLNGTYGGYNIYINNGGAFKPSTTTNQANRTRANTLYASFQDIYNSLSSIYNLSMYPYFQNGTQYVRIDQENYFFPQTSPQSLQINDVKLISKKKDSEFSISKLNYSQMNQNSWAYLQSEVGYISNDCTDRDASINTSLSFPQDGFLTNTDLIDTDAVYMVDWGGYVALNAAQPQLLWGIAVIPGSTIPANEFNGSVSYVNEFTTITGPPYYGRFIIHAGSAVHPLVAKNYAIRSSNGLKIKGITVDNLSSVHIKYLYNIEVPLTRTQLSLILADPPAPIIFNGITGWILNMSHDIKTGMTNFDLLTE